MLLWDGSTFHGHDVLIILLVRTLREELLDFSRHTKTGCLIIGRPLAKHRDYRGRIYGAEMTLCMKRNVATDSAYFSLKSSKLRYFVYLVDSLLRISCGCLAFRA